LVIGQGFLLFPIGVIAVPEALVGGGVPGVQLHGGQVVAGGLAVVLGLVELVTGGAVLVGGARLGRGQGRKEEGQERRQDEMPNDGR
jgi:hypothetical protein